MTGIPTKLAGILKDTAGELGVVGASVVSRAGGPAETFWLPRSNDEPAFLAYSITKTFTSALILRLCEERCLTLDEPLTRWFPNIAKAERISLRHLLNHTAGIPDYGHIRQYHDAVRCSPSTPWSFERFAAETFDKGLRFEPGTSWAYSNPGYMLLKRIAEEVAGMPYADLIFERIARPLELSRTFVPESIKDLASLAPGISCELARDGAPRDVREYYHPGWVSHGVVASTPSDIVRFFDGLFFGRLLARPSLDQMTALVPIAVPTAAEPPPTAPQPWGKPSYGLGLMGDPASPWGLVLGHNGGGPCYSASAFHAPELGGVSVCVMGAIEKGFSAEKVVFALLDWFASSAEHAGVVA